MFSLTHELQRLFGAHPDQPVLQLGEGGVVRALVLGVSHPADWRTLAQAWRGVQADLEWPAAAIAVNGRDGFMVCWPLAQPMPVAQAINVLRALRVAYLPDVPTERVMQWPAAVQPEALWLPPLALDAAGGDTVWSAFVAPDLAPVFEDTPWLDVTPSPEGQAELLARIKTVALGDVQRAMAGPLAAALRRAEGVVARGAAMAPQATASPASSGAGLTDVAASVAGSPDPAGPEGERAAAGWAFHDPSDFLRAVMNDGQVDMAHRIEAAKALLLAPR